MDKRQLPKRLVYKTVIAWPFFPTIISNWQHLAVQFSDSNKVLFRFIEYQKESVMLKALAIAILSISMLALAGCASPGPRYKNVRSFSEGLAPVQASNGRWGYINERQRIVIPARFEDAKEFKEGKAAVKLNGRWGFINKRGEWL